MLCSNGWNKKIKKEREIKKAKDRGKIKRARKRRGERVFVDRWFWVSNVRWKNHETTLKPFGGKISYGEREEEGKQGENLREREKAGDSNFFTRY